MFIIIGIFFLVVIGSILVLYFLSRGSKSPQGEEVSIQRLKTLDNLYLKFDPTLSPQMLGKFSTTSDKQNASEFILNVGSSISYIQRPSNNSISYEIYKLNVVEPNNNIYAEDRSYNSLQLSREADNFILKTLDQMKCLHTNYQICVISDPSCKCLPLINE